MANPRPRSLLNGEQVLAQWSTLTLTSYRLWSHQPTDGGEEMHAVLRPSVDGAAFRRASEPGWLVLAVLVGPLALASMGAGSSHDSQLLVGLGGFFLVLALVALVAYVASRKTILEVNAGRVRVAATVGGSLTDAEQARAFLHHVELHVLRLHGVRV